MTLVNTFAGEWKGCSEPGVKTGPQATVSGGCAGGLETRSPWVQCPGFAHACIGTAGARCAFS